MISSLTLKYQGQPTKGPFGKSTFYHITLQYYRVPWLDLPICMVSKSFDRLRQYHPNSRLPAIDFDVPDLPGDS